MIHLRLMSVVVELNANLLLAVHGTFHFFRNENHQTKRLDENVDWPANQKAIGTRIPAAARKMLIELNVPLIGFDCPRMKIYSAMFSFDFRVALFLLIASSSSSKKLKVSKLCAITQ